MEMMLAFSLMTLFLTSAIALSATMQELRYQAIRELKNLELALANTSSSTLQAKKKYGNDSEEIIVEPLTMLLSNYTTAWGRDGCSVEFSDDFDLYFPSLNISNNPPTDIEVRNGVAYITTDSATASMPDVYIIDMGDPELPITMSSLNTGPGLSSLEIAGHYIYAANSGTTNHLQVIDIRNRNQPVLISTLKLPPPNASSTPTTATSIFYSKGQIYLGTEKWEGREFSVIDVSKPSAPRYVGGFEIDTLVNDIYIRGDIAYVAASNVGQMRILDVRNPSSISEADAFSPTGWETQEGKIISYFENVLSLGRTVGGFNAVNNHEIFIFASTTLSRDVPGGVYGIVHRPPYIYLAVGSVGREFQVWKDDLSSLILERSIGFLPKAMACDGNNLYII